MRRTNPRRACNMPAALADLPPAPEVVEYSGPLHGDGRIVECRWYPRHGVQAGAYLADYGLDAARLAATPPHLGAILTAEDRGGQWEPVTMAMESESLPGEWGLFAAANLPGGELVSCMRDGLHLGQFRLGSVAARAAVAAAGGATAHYLYTYRGGLYDGRTCRPGGAKNANDARGTGLAVNTEFLTTGCLNVLPGGNVIPLHRGQSRAGRRHSELLWDYGVAFWQAR